MTRWTNFGAMRPKPFHSHNGWLSGNTPLPLIVVATGATSRSERSTTRSAAPAAPEPT